MAANNDAPEFRSLNNAMHKLFFSKDGADVTFIVHGEEIQAHKHILVARSPVFKAMIEGPLAPADQRHLIDDPEISFEDFQDFVHFLYTDRCQMYDTNVKALLHLGNFYDIPFFLERCVATIVKGFLNDENALEFAEMGLTVAPTSSLLEVSLHRFFSFFDSIDETKLAYRLEDESLKWISAGLVLEIVKQHKNSAKKDALFKKVFQWAENECVRQGQEISPGNIRTIMTPMMPYIDPKQLLPTTLAATIKMYKLIPDDELINCLADYTIKVCNENRNFDVPLSERFLPHNQSGTRNNVQNVDQYRPLHYNPVRINRNLDQGRDDHDQYVRFLDDYRPLHDHEVRRESNLDQGRHDPHQFHPLPGDEYVRADLDYD